jgi:hypothetical protein
MPWRSWKHVLTCVIHLIDPILKKKKKKIPAFFFFLAFIALVRELMDRTVYYITSIQRSVPVSRYCFLVNGLGVKDRFHSPAFFRSDSFIFQFRKIRGGWVVLSSDTYSHPWAAAAHYRCGERSWLRYGTAGVGKLTYRGGMYSVTKWTCMKYDVFTCVL